MSLVEHEVIEIQKLCKNVVPNSKIIVCSAEAPALVRVDLKIVCENQNQNQNQDQDQNQSETQRQITVCLRFPEDYPNQSILIELKSRTLSSKFLDGLTKLCEAQAKQQLQKPQGLVVLRFAQNYLQENPLCVCYEEIQQLKQELGSNAYADQLKLKQRSSTIVFTAKGGDYFYKVRAVIPEEYPKYCVDLGQPETNLPAVLERYLNGQSREIARQCVEPPIRATKRELENFQPKPSLFLTLKFSLEATRDFPIELCPICDKTVLPANPKDVVLDDTKNAFLERVYCGHLFHQGCLKQYIHEPPFPKGGKLCPAKRRHARSDARSYLNNISSVAGSVATDKSASKSMGDKSNRSDICGLRLSHDRWVVNVKLAEARWAQKKARERELEEVIDFLK